MLTIERRTFEAAKHPLGSPERAAANLCATTSEYMPGYRYLLVCSENGLVQWTKLCRTKKAAHEAILAMPLSSRV